MMKYKLAIIVRKDIHISHGKAIVQGAHAALDCAVKCMSADEKMFLDWYREGERKIAYKVQTLEEIMYLAERAENAKLVAVVVRDMGLTQVEPDTVTCVGIGPAEESKIDAICANLQLY